MIIVALTSVGLKKSFSYMSNINDFRQYKIFLLNMKKYISTSSLTVYEIIEQSEDEFSTLLKKNAKTGDYKNACQNLFLNKDDKRDMCYFFEKLGRSTREEQIADIDMQIKNCEDRIGEEKETYKEKAKVNIMFYSFIGIAATLVLF